MNVDALFVADPSNSYYLQDPTGKWEGVSYYEALLRRYTPKYRRVLLIGSSMGASACLQHAYLGHRAIAFAPRIDLSASHGTYIPLGARTSGLERTRRSLTKMGGTACVHCGRSNYVDLAQVEHVRDLPKLQVRAWPTFHHNVPAWLEKEGRLVPLIKQELVRLLLEDHAAEA